MKYWITLSRGESAANSQIIARTADPVLVRQVLKGIVTNRLLEDDDHDRVTVPDFIAFATAAIAALSAELRRTGCRAWPRVAPRGPVISRRDPNTRSRHLRHRTPMREAGRCGRKRPRPRVSPWARFLPTALPA